jgi:hypothetical protein
MGEGVTGVASFAVCALDMMFLAFCAAGSEAVRRAGVNFGRPGVSMDFKL